MGLLKQSGLYLAGRIVPALVGVGGVAIYTRLLDPASIGTYALLLSIALLANSIGFTWLRIAALRFAAGMEGELAPDFAKTVGLGFAATAVLAAIVEGAAVRLYQPNDPWLLVGLTVAAAIASAWYDLNASLLQARLDAAGWGALNFARAVVAVACSAGLILAFHSAAALLAGFVLGNVATVAFARMWLPAAQGRFDGQLLRRCFTFGWPQSVNTAQASLGPVVQRWLVQIAAGTAAVGIFAVANDFSSQTIASLVGSISLAGIPLAFKAKERGDERGLYAQLAANAKLIFGIALPAATGFVVLAEPIAHTVFGARFWSGAPPVLMLIGIAAFALNVRVYYFDQSFELALETRPQAAIALAGTIVTIGATFALVPHFAAIGAAFAQVAGALLSLATSIVWGRRFVPMPIPADDWLRTALATAGMALVLALFPKDIAGWELAVALASGAAVYGVLSSATRLSLIRSRYGARFAWLQRP